MGMMKKLFKKLPIIAQWMWGIFFACFVIVNGFHWSSLLLFAAAVLMLPIPLIRNVLKKVSIKKFKIKTWLIVTLSVVFLFVGILCSPLGESAEENGDLPGYSEENDPVDPPSDPVDPPSDPVDPPSDPVDPPSDPVDPPSDPVDPPSDPVDQPSDPVDPPSDPVDPPSDPVDPPSDPVDPPSDPVDPPSDPVDPPSDPVDQPNESDDPAIPNPPVGNGVATPVDPTTLPVYSGTPFVIVDNNIPSFGSDELVIVGYEKYAELDSLGRCGVALASCGIEIMPAPDEERGSISSITPTGWVQASYEGVSGSYLWNRCHLIGWQLSAENANRQNLITGTRYMNVSGMLPFENMIADYIKETGNHVALRVTPIFEGNNLVCSGVQMEAYSIEDNGEGICFNVYFYNIQPGIVIDYATGASHLPGGDDDTPSDGETPEIPGDNESDDDEPKEEIVQMVYIPKTGTKYHSNPNCGTMKNPNEVTLEEAEHRGFTPCSKCYG